MKYIKHVISYSCVVIILCFTACKYYRDAWKRLASLLCEPAVKL